MSYINVKNRELLMKKYLPPTLDNYEIVYNLIKNDEYDFNHYEKLYGYNILGSPIFNSLTENNANDKALALFELCVSKNINIKAYDNANHMVNKSLTILRNIKFVKENIDKIIELGLDIKTLEYGNNLSLVDNTIETIEQNPKHLLNLLKNNPTQQINEPLLTLINSLEDESEQEEFISKLLKKGLNPNLLLNNYYDLKTLCHIDNINIFRMLKERGCKINDSYFVLNFLTKKIADCDLQQKFKIIEDNLELFNLNNMKDFINKLNISNKKLNKNYTSQEPWENLFENSEYYVYKNHSFADIFIEQYIFRLSINHKNFNYWVDKFKSALDYFDSIGLEIRNKTINISYWQLDLINTPEVVNHLINNNIKLDLNELIKTTKEQIEFNKNRKIKYKNNIFEYCFSNEAGIRFYLQKNNKKLSDIIDIKHFIHDRDVINTNIDELYSEGYRFERYIPTLMNNINSKILIDFLNKNYKDDFYNHLINKKELSNDCFSKLSNSLKIYLFKKADIKNQEDFNKLFLDIGEIVLTHSSEEKYYRLTLIKDLLKNKKTKMFLTNYLKNNTNNIINKALFDFPYQFLELLKENNIPFNLKEGKYLIKASDYNLCEENIMEKLSKNYDDLNRYFSQKFSLRIRLKQLIEYFCYDLKEKNHDVDFIKDNISFFYPESKNIITLPENFDNVETINKSNQFGYNIYDYFFSVISLSNNLEVYDCSSIFYEKIKDLNKCLFNKNFKQNKDHVEYLIKKIMDNDDKELFLYMRRKCEKNIIMEQTNTNNININNINNTNKNNKKVKIRRHI